MTQHLHPDSDHQRIWLGPFLIAVVTLIAILLTLDPSTSWPRGFEGPGITLDESFNVQMGAFYVQALSAYGGFIFDPEIAREVFTTDGYNPDHPPLGRIWLGIFQELAAKSLPATGLTGAFITLLARTGSAVAFALTVFVIGLFTSKHFGRRAGMIAALALVCMPRLFGHAHLASLETVLNLMWTLAVLGIAQTWPKPVTQSHASHLSDQPSNLSDVASATPTALAAVLTGVLLGLVALTKIQFVLLPPVVIVWALWFWRAKAVRPIAIWGTTGFAVFWLGWPWLWLKIPDNLLAFLGRSTDRVALKCYYFGTIYADRDVPWHYPWVMFLATLPLALVLLGAWGFVSQRKQLLTDPRIALLVLTMLAPLCLFSTSVAVYDGERLFLPSFISWAIFAGIGGTRLYELLHAHVRRPAIGLAAALLMMLSGLFSVGPYWLSYYGGLVGGLRGASSLGLEINYWGDSFSRSMWERVAAHVPDHEAIAVAPVLHQFHLREIVNQNIPVQQHGWRIEPFDPRFARALFLLTYERRADRQTDAELRAVGFQPIEHIQRQGVPLGTLWKREKVILVK